MKISQLGCLSVFFLGGLSGCYTQVHMDLESDMVVFFVRQLVDLESCVAGLFTS